MDMGESKNTVRKMINILAQDELEKLKRDLDSGGKFINDLVTKKLIDLNSKPSKICATCGSNISDKEFTLTFGPVDFRKKASFCAQDCLEYFLDNLKPKIPVNKLTSMQDKSKNNSKNYFYNSIERGE